MLRWLPSKITRVALALVAATATTVAVAGCGGAAATGAPPAAEAPPATSVDQAKVRLEEADRAVRLALGEPGDSLQQSAAPGVAAPPPPPPPVQAGASGASKESPAAPMGDAGATKAPDACKNACLALSSMHRAADQLCTLAGGDADPRCGDARDRVKRADTQVHARCPGC